MSLTQNLILPTNKSLTNFEGLTIRQSEKGLTVTANILNYDDSPYDLTDKSLTFKDNKDNDKFVVDGNIQVVDPRAGTISYVLHPQVYASTGTAWFEIYDKSGKLVDSTNNFTIEVKDDANASVYNTNYISALEDLRTQMQNIVDSTDSKSKKMLTDTQHNFDTTLSNMTDSFNQAQINYHNQFNAQLSKQQSDFENSQNSRSTDWNNTKNVITGEWASLKSDYSNQIKKQQDSYTSAENGRNTDWSNDKARIDSDYNSVKDSYTKQIVKQQSDFSRAQNIRSTDWTNNKNSINAEWNMLKTSLNGTITNLGNQLSSIQTSITGINNNSIPNINNKIADLNAAIKNAQDTFKQIDFTHFIKSINGISPDSNGNVAITTDNVTGLTDLLNNAKNWNYSGEIAGNEDLNNYGKNGRFLIRNDKPLNYPTGASGQRATLFVFNHDNGQILQVYVAEDDVWTRVLTGTTPQKNWSKVLNDSYVPDWNSVVNKPSFSYSLYNGDIHWNSGTNQFEFFTKSYTSNSVKSGDMHIDFDDDQELTNTATKLTEIKNKADAAITPALLDAAIQKISFRQEDITDYKNGSALYSTVVRRATKQGDGTYLINNYPSNTANTVSQLAAAINTLQAQVTALQQQPARGFTDVDGVHYDVKYLTQRQYDALSTIDSNTLYIIPES